MMAGTSVATAWVVVALAVHAAATCKKLRCLNGGRCVSDQRGGEHCACATGFTGNTCFININDCPVRPCSGLGKCIDGINKYICHCDKGFYGDKCEYVDNCHDIPCYGNGQCATVDNSYICDCYWGYEGTNCRTSRISVISGFQRPLYAGDDLKLSCRRLDKHIARNYLWYFLPLGAKRGRLVSMSETLSRPHISVADSGNYTCVVGSHFGSATSTVTVDVLSKTPAGGGMIGRAVGVIEEQSAEKSPTLFFIIIGVSVGSVVLVVSIGLTAYLVRRVIRRRHIDRELAKLLSELNMK